MHIKTKAIVLSSLKFQEKSLIVKCFTLSHGLKSYFVRDAFSSRKSNQKIAYFQPLTILEIEAVHKNKGTLENFKEIKIASPFHAINSLTEHETNLFKKLIDLKFDNNQKTFHVIERQIILRILIDYYSFHLSGFKKPKSLDVLKEIFS